MGRVVAPADVEELVRADRHPRSHRAVRPGDPDLGPGLGAEADVDPAELTADVPAADRHLAALGRRSDLDLEPGPDGVPVRPGL